MNGSRFNVLLYSDESKSAFYALVYSAILMMNMPNMHLTVVQLKESKDSFIGAGGKCLSFWPISPTSSWMKEIIGRADPDEKTCYCEILTKTNELFTSRTVDFSYQVLYCNPNIPDTVNALLQYARKNSIELLVMGTSELWSLKDLIFGNLAHAVQNRSPIPVLLVKKLSQDFLAVYRSKSVLKLVQN